MATLTPSVKQQFFDANGNPLAGGKLYTYAAGTTIPLATYTDSSGGTPNTNPVILDSRGEANVWLGTLAYKFKLTTSTDVELWTVDNVQTDYSDALSDLSATGGSSLVGFLQSGNGSTARTVQAKLREFVSVKDFGAIGDGITDDTAAFASAITASDDVIVPDGTYVLSSVSGKSNLQLVALGRAKLLHKPNVVAGQHMLNFTNCNNWILRGFEIDGNKSNQTQSVSCIQVKNNSVGWIIENCYIHDAKIFGISVLEDAIKPSNWTIQNCRSDSCGDSGFYTNGAYRGRFYGCSAQTNASQGFAFLGASSYLSMTDCLAVSNGANGFFFGSANNCTAVGCYSKSNGYTSGGSGFGFNTSIASTCFKNTLIGCRAESNHDDGVDINNAAGAEISNHRIMGCHFDSNNSGINCINSNFNYFSGNCIVVSKYNGIHVQASDRNVISGNGCYNNGTFAANTYHGIYVDGSSDYNYIEGNVCTNDGGAANQKYGIYIDSGATGNRLLSNDTTGNATGTINNDGAATDFWLNRAFKNPAFYANKTATQTISNTTATKVTFSTERFNVENTFNNSVSRWTPKFIGKYQVNAQITFTTSVNQTKVYIELQKNGNSHILQANYASGTGGISVQINAIVDVTAAEDYFEIFAYQSSGGDLTITNDAPQTFFSAAKIAD